VLHFEQYGILQAERCTLVSGFCPPCISLVIVCCCSIGHSRGNNIFLQTCSKAIMWWCDCFHSFPASLIYLLETLQLQSDMTAHILLFRSIGMYLHCDVQFSVYISLTSFLNNIVIILIGILVYSKDGSTMILYLNCSELSIYFSKGKIL
jgi:hypothetical protein